MDAARRRVLRLGHPARRARRQARCCRGPSPPGSPTCPGTAFYADGAPGARLAAAVVLLPRARPHPRGRPPARRRRGGGARADQRPSAPTHAAPGRSGAGADSPSARTSHEPPDVTRRSMRRRGGRPRRRALARARRLAALRPPGRRRAARRRGSTSTRARRRRRAAARRSRPTRPTSSVPLLHGAGGRGRRRARRPRAARHALCRAAPGRLPASPSTSRSPRRPWRAAGLATPGLRGPAARDVPRARRAGGARGHRGAPRAAARGQALPRRVGARRVGGRPASTDLPGRDGRRFAYGDTALVERLVAGTEVAVSRRRPGDGPVALPAVEIVPDGGSTTTPRATPPGRTEFFAPARLDRGRRRALRRGRAARAPGPRAARPVADRPRSSTPTGSRGSSRSTRARA